MSVETQAFRVQWDLFVIAALLTTCLKLGCVSGVATLPWWYIVALGTFPALISIIVTCVTGFPILIAMGFLATQIWWRSLRARSGRYRT